MGVNINVLNQSLKRIAVVDDYTSLIWAKRYYDIGALDLQIEATAKNLEIFKKDNYITRDDDDAVYRIEALELDTSVEHINYIIVGAYDCKKILNQRIVWKQLNFQGTVENFIRKIITDNVINPTISQRRINNFLLKAAKGFTEQIEAQTTYDNVSEKITELCIANGYGWRVTLENGAWYFDLYKGADRSIDQNANPHVVFSPEYDNLTSTKYKMDASEFKNVALVAGEGEGVQRKTRTIGNAAGIDRFEVFIESNASSTTESGDLVDYYQALIADGKEQLAEKSVTTTFEGEIDTNFYKYKIDYNLGDIVTVTNEYGIKVNARIVEVAETWDKDGYTIDPVFEYMEVEEAEITGALLTESKAMLKTEKGGVLLAENAERAIQDETSKKISELPAASSVGANDILPIVQSGETKQIAASAIQNLAWENISNYVTLTKVSNNINAINLEYCHISGNFIQIRCGMKIQNAMIANDTYKFSIKSTKFRMDRNISKCSGASYYDNNIFSFLVNEYYNEDNVVSMRTAYSVSVPAGSVIGVSLVIPIIRL